MFWLVLQSHRATEGSRRSKTERGRITEGLGCSCFRPRPHRVRRFPTAGRGAPVCPMSSLANATNRVFFPSKAPKSWLSLLSLQPLTPQRLTRRTRGGKKKNARRPANRSCRPGRGTRLAVPTLGWHLAQLTQHIKTSSQKTGAWARAVDPSQGAANVTSHGADPHPCSTLRDLCRSLCKIGADS
jgi:hypothetical protein